jgi:hypothetical protein
MQVLTLYLMHVLDAIVKSRCCTCGSKKQLIVRHSTVTVLVFLLQAVSVSTSSVVGLVQAVGVSSSFVAQKTQGGKEGREELLSVEEFDYWNLWDFKGVYVTFISVTFNTCKSMHHASCTHCKGSQPSQGAALTPSCPNIFSEYDKLQKAVH